MRRELILGILIAAGALAIAAASQQAPAPMVIQVEKLKDNMFVLRGGGGNTTVFVQANGVTVVDTKNPGWGQPLLNKIRELTDKPVTTIINTHAHFDHVSGNVDFPPTVDIVTQENTAANMKRIAAVPALPPVTGFGGTLPANVLAENRGRGLPTRTYRDGLTLGTGVDRIDLRYFGRGHTNGDAWVVFPAMRVLAAGDIFSGKNLPLLDYNNGGSGAEIPDTLMKAYTGTVTDVDSIVTGHSTIMAPNDLREYAEFNRDFRDAVREGKKNGRSVDELAKSWRISERYKGYAAPDALRLRTNIENIYREVP
jgi:glyoxylase-like metal-dependent hydrolase (beta-lactamase superfamily II)